jgi:hypothetical protein
MHGGIMHWSSRVSFAIALLCCVAGCTTERQQLEDERSGLQTANDGLWNHLRHHAPVGGQWAGHPDTGGLIEQIQRNDTRIREIDQKLLDD